MSDLDATAPLAVRPPGADTPTGTLIGRYVVLGSLGAGGGGEVFAAYDPQLDRKVAVKRLRSSGDTELLLREARMLAKLRHPDVVTVYDVGVDDNDEAYLAMELVEGKDLGRWLAEHGSASGPDKLAMLRAAALGLQAAHEGGVVHGDVKPANILVGDDGRVLVGDFGVARLVSAQEGEGRVVGTPLYMAPEQHDGRVADVRSDVFAFAATAWTALVGIHPFSNTSGSEVTPASGTSAGLYADATNSASGAAGLVAITEAKRLGPPPLPDPLPDVPRARELFDVLRAGLQPDAAARPEAIERFVEVMTVKPQSRWWVPAAAVGLVGGAGALVLAGPPEETRCAGSSERLADVWTPTRAAALEAHWQGMGPPWQARASELRETLDGYAQRWVVAHQANCEATSILAEQSPADADLRNRCLLDARGALGASASLLEEADVEVARQADTLTNALPNLERCADVRQIEAQTRIPDSPELRADVDAIRDALPAARAELWAARFPEALAAIGPLVEQARALDYAPLVVELAPAWAGALDRTGDTKAAYEVWEACVQGGLELGLHGPAFDCAARMAEVLAQRDSRLEAAEAWVTVAQGLSERPDARATAVDDVMRARSIIAFEATDYARALEIDRALVQRIIDASGPDHQRVGTALVSQGNSELRAGELKAAEATLTRAREILEASLGPEHPTTAATVMALGTVLESRGANEEALALMREAERGLVAALGPEHEEVALLRTNIAVNLTALGEFEDALAEYSKSLAIVEGRHGPGHVEAGRIQMNVGVVELRQQDFERARKTLRGALDIFEDTLPELHEHRISCKMNLALAIASLGDIAEARPLLEEVLEARVATMSQTHPAIAGIRGNLGHMLLELEEPAEAKAQFDAALAIRAAHPSRPKDRAFETLGLARAEHALGNKAKGIALAQEAIGLWKDAGPGYDSYREDAIAWVKRVR
ncbi:MAG: protein kinase domain-containing protein [Nannocystales bacterium]